MVDCERDDEMVNDTDEIVDCETDDVIVNDETDEMVNDEIKIFFFKYLDFTISLSFSSSVSLHLFHLITSGHLSVLQSLILNGGDVFLLTSQIKRNDNDEEEDIVENKVRKKEIEGWWFDRQFFTIKDIFACYVYVVWLFDCQIIYIE